MAQSVIVRTGQGRKAYLALGGCILGGSLISFGSAFLHPATSTTGLLVQLGGTTMALCSFFFGCRAVRCPACNAKWIWDAMRRNSVNRNRWLYALIETRSCPYCGHPEATRQVRIAKWCLSAKCSAAQADGRFYEEDGKPWENIR